MLDGKPVYLSVLTFKHTGMTTIGLISVSQACNVSQCNSLKRNVLKCNASARIVVLGGKSVYLSKCLAVCPIYISPQSGHVSSYVPLFLNFGLLHCLLFCQHLLDNEHAIRHCEDLIHHQ